MRIRVSDAAAAPALLEHLAAQGFPARYVGRDELDVLFPGSPSLFAAAAELDLWRARHPQVALAFPSRPRAARAVPAHAVG